MTAQTGEMNSLGVELATDSAVTLTYGNRIGKIYASTDKLFHLSSSAPVGLMAYGNIEYWGLPWETIVKSYRKEMAENTFKTIEDYTADFIRFLKKNAKIFPVSGQDGSIERIIVHFFQDIRNEVLLERKNLEETKKAPYTDEDAQQFRLDKQSSLHAVHCVLILPGHWPISPFIKLVRFD